MQKFVNMHLHWDRKSFEKYSIADLVSICITRRSKKSSFKEILIDYLIKIGPGKPYA